MPKQFTKLDLLEFTIFNTWKASTDLLLNLLLTPHMPNAQLTPAVFYHSVQSCSFRKHIPCQTGAGMCFLMRGRLNNNQLANIFPETRMRRRLQWAISVLKLHRYPCSARRLSARSRIIIGTPLCIMSEDLQAGREIMLALLCLRISQPVPSQIGDLHNSFLQ